MYMHMHIRILFFSLIHSYYHAYALCDSDTLFYRPSMFTGDALLQTICVAHAAILINARYSLSLFLGFTKKMEKLYEKKQTKYSLSTS